MLVNVPMRHLSQTRDDGFDEFKKDPASQSRQNDAPTVSVKEPDGQGSQELRPLTSVYFPEAHVSHFVIFCKGAIEPGLHAEQNAEPFLSDIKPCGHG